MTTTKVPVIIILLALVSLSCLPQQTAGQYRLPDIYRTKQYVTNLIDSYNSQVDQYAKPRSDFINIKPYLSLYHEAGNSFKVIVFQIDTYNPGNLCLVFLPLPMSQPVVIMDPNATFNDLFPTTDDIIIGWYIIRENLPLSYNGTVTRQNFIYEIPTRDISNYDSINLSNSEKAARDIYQQNQKKFPTASQTMTIVQTISQTRSQSGQDWFSGVLSSPISWVAGVLTLIIFAWIPWYFGSFREFVRVMGNEEERKNVVLELRKLVKHKVKTEQD